MDNSNQGSPEKDKKDWQCIIFDCLLANIFAVLLLVIAGGGGLSILAELKFFVALLLVIAGGGGLSILAELKFTTKNKVLAFFVIFPQLCHIGFSLAF